MVFDVRRLPSLIDRLMALLDDLEERFQTDLLVPFIATADSLKEVRNHLS